MEPWLDSLSEDWNSEPRTSSPAPSAEYRSRSNTQKSSQSQSRIPHLTQSLRKDSRTGSFLRPRSTRGIAKANGIPVLSERSPSSLNLLPSSPQSDSGKRRVSTIPRRVSSTFSDSQQSVQRHTVDSTSKLDDTPEWKKKLVRGDDVVSDGFDLFSPSKLEGMFAQPASKSEVDEESSLLERETRPWTALKFTQIPPAHEQQQQHSMRTSRSRRPVMEALEEVNEDEDEEGEEPDVSAISSDLERIGSLRGLVQRRVSTLEQIQPQTQSERQPSYSSQDPRWRTCSGQQEIRNELISPVTASAQNTIREKALRDSVDLNPDIVRAKLMELDRTKLRRPSSRSSDHDISYRRESSQEESLLQDEPLPDMTSHSLPEDLSMGTQEFFSHGSHIKPKRGAPSNEASFIRRRPSSAVDSSRFERVRNESASRFRSSPPPYTSLKDNNPDVSKLTESLPNSPQDTSVVRHSPSSVKPDSSRSPLKLFGNRDTYTNNKLMRVLSQYEEDGSESSKMHHEETEQNTNDQPDTGLRMSQFGMGELDSFHFEKEVERPRQMISSYPVGGERIFQDFANLNINESTSAKAATSNQQKPSVEAADVDNAKRLPSSPAKDRTSKRRRTLLRDEIVVGGVGIELEVHQLPEQAIVAGRKRKDARPGEDGSQADPETLASRNILRPKAGSRKSSAASQQRVSSTETINTQIGPSLALTEALAAELASFAQGVPEAGHESRKASLATKDYMEEANKVMEIIRNRGKPKPKLPEIQEPEEPSELNPDAILDLEIDDDSTKDSFSRPPSREGPVKPREDRRHAKHTSRVASHLRKFQEPEDLELLASTSAIGTFKLVDNEAADEAALVPVPGDDQESSPPNMRILNHDDNLLKRKHSESMTNGQQSIDSSSTRQTFPSDTSNSSGQKGIITSGTVSIPDHVGTMTFDREKQIWVKQQMAKEIPIRADVQQHFVHNKETTLDDDPFDSIPDLSIDEKHEEALKKVPKSPRPSTADTIRPVLKTVENTSIQSDKQSQDLESRSQPVVSPSISPINNRAAHDKNGIFQTSSERQVSVHSEVSKHEERLHDGIPSRGPILTGSPNRQPRAVTIAFSSPVAREIPYQPSANLSDAELDDDDFLPPEDSDLDDEAEAPKIVSSIEHNESNTEKGSIRSSISRHEQYRSMTLNRRPVSRIDEHDEENLGTEGLSLVHVKESVRSTPKSNNLIARSNPTSAYKGSSILCLTPLSEFTMHQADRANHPEESFVAARPNPKALLQAHGSLTLAVDALVKAITDAAPTEPFWEQLRGLDLTEKRLTSLHALDEYCPVLEDLVLSNNSIAQLNGLPSSIRQLDVKNNRINDFTAWGHLQNLQYIDVSGNQLENLEGFSSLVHMRTLKVCNNQIRDVEGVLDLDGLIRLDLSGNQLTSINFEGVDLPRLEELDLSHNNLNSIENLHYLPRLRKLNLDSNNLKEIGMSTVISSLTSLSIAHNEIRLLNLDHLPAIERLNLDNNCLQTLDGLSNAGKLRSLSARDQKASGGIINQILTTSNECDEIMLSSNILSGGVLTLPSYPHYNLRHLELAGCGLQALPTTFGDFFPNCRELNLNFNAMQDLSPLLGCIKLQTLMLSGNRIKRLRRTCLTVARLPVLQHLDIRENPLTVGFYAPIHRVKDDINVFMLPSRIVQHDIRWLQTLDETTTLRRRMIEMMLAEGCKRLTELDGGTFDRHNVLKLDTVWMNLTSKGVLVKAIEGPPVQLAEMGAPGYETNYLEHSLETNDIGMERSLQVE